MADLEAAVASDALDRWLDRVPDAARPELRRALELDRPVWTRCPDSVASCLLARIVARGPLAALYDGWVRELDARGMPWIAALRPLPMKDGPLAERALGDDLALAEGGELWFPSEDVVWLLPGPEVRPDPRRHGGLCWAWARGDVTFPPQRPARPARDEYPKIEVRGPGEVFATVAPGAAAVRVPCSDCTESRARLMADGVRVVLYGDLGEYDGGFVQIVNLTTLAVERWISPRHGVAAVLESAGSELVLILDGGVVVLCSETEVFALPLCAALAGLSPTGAHLAVLDGGLSIWSVADLLRAARAQPGSGFPTCFDPDGHYLLSNRVIYDGHSGRPMATLDASFERWLEGGPAMPWLHFGTQHLISMHSGLHVWDTRTGTAMPVRNPRAYPQWYMLAYDRPGTRLAALMQDTPNVILRALPSGDVLHELSFELPGSAIAMSPDGELIALGCGGSIEVRSADGALVMRDQHASGVARTSDDELRFPPVLRRGPSRVAQRQEATLRFSHDGRRLARFTPEDGWLIWTLGDRGLVHVPPGQFLDDVAGFETPWPADWMLEPDAFVHHPSGTRIALPFPARWVSNPANPRILACAELHIELRAEPAPPSHGSREVGS